MHPHDRVFHAVLKGGGPRGFPYLGAIDLLQQQGYQVGQVRGTSAGAIIGSLLAIGMTAREIIESVYGTDFDTFRRGRFTSRFPIFQTAMGGVLSLPFDLINFALYGGFYSRRALEAWMRARFEQKDVDPDLTYKDLPNFRAYAMDVSDKQTQRILEFGSKTTPDVAVIKGVSMSSSVPVIFEPERYDGSLVVDGAWANNIPMQSFAVEEKHGTLDAPVMVMTNQLERPVDTSSSPLFYKVLYFLFAVLKKFPLSNAVAGPAEALLDAQDEIARQLYGDWAHFVELDSDVGVLHFGFDRGKKQRVVQRGANDLQRYLETEAGLGFRLDVFFAQIQRVLENMPADSQYRYEVGFEFASAAGLRAELKDALKAKDLSDAVSGLESLGFWIPPASETDGISRLTVRIDAQRQEPRYASLLASIEENVNRLEQVHTTNGNGEESAEEDPSPFRLNDLTGWQLLRKQYDPSSQLPRPKLHMASHGPHKKPGSLGADASSLL